MILIISGLQGVGKTTIINEILKLKPQYRLSISATTRIKRVNETHQEYDFLSLKDFNHKEKSGYFLETVNFNGNKYGTPLHELNENIILNVNPSSILNFKKLLEKYNYKSIFIDAHEDLLKERLMGRDGHNIQDKINTWKQEIEYKKHFEHVIENIHLTKTIQNILKII